MMVGQKRWADHKVLLEGKRCYFHRSIPNYFESIKIIIWSRSIKFLEARIAPQLLLHYMSRPHRTFGITWSWTNSRIAFRTSLWLCSGAQCPAFVHPFVIHPFVCKASCHCAALGLMWLPS
jgi:hypothetical protein